MATWEIAGGLVTKEVQEYFLRSRLAKKKVKSTIITLISNVDNPTTLKDYRSISCCNVIYKFITKNISNRSNIFYSGMQD